MKERVKVQDIRRRKFLVHLPERFKSTCYPTTILVKLVDGEMQYIPRAYTFLCRTNFSSDELRSIADKLDELNKKV